jgi:uridine monophosphate synthetase
VITTGASVLKVADTLIHEGLQVTDMVVLVDRQQGGRETLIKAGYRLHAVFNLDELYKK